MKRVIATSRSMQLAPLRPKNAIRLMVVDDSITARTVFARMLKSEADLEVVASASSAEQAIEVLKSVAVDVILLDLEMPGMGGLKALPLLIQASRGARVLVVSSHTDDGAEQAMAALSVGAADTLPKPANGQFNANYSETFVGKIREVGCARTARLKMHIRKTQPKVPARRIGTNAQVIAIGASTGGIHALSTLFQALPGQLGVPILVTQHLPGALMPTFARQLSQAAGLPAIVGEDDMLLKPDQILIAPGDAHLTVVRSGSDLVVRLDRRPAASGCMPSVDPMFASLAETLRGGALGVVLSGMGKDGLHGANSIVEEGGAIIAQNQETSAVWGMPRAVTEAGLVSAVLPPEQIALRLASYVKTKVKL